VSRSFSRIRGYDAVFAGRIPEISNNVQNAKSCARRGSAGVSQQQIDHAREMQAEEAAEPRGSRCHLFKVDRRTLYRAFAPHEDSGARKGGLWKRSLERPDFYALHIIPPDVVERLRCKQARQQQVCVDLL
jgi:hypothetical protein